MSAGGGCDIQGQTADAPDAGSLRGPILLTGASGQVGSAMLRAFAGEQVLAPVRAQMDLADAESIVRTVRTIRPRWIVNCAAYTAVDAAEADRDAAFAVNATGPAILAEEAARIGAGVIHLSTDYVFDGSGTRPWTEADPAAPCNVYGASKLAGEQAIAASGAAHLVLRTSWVFGLEGHNFLRTMLRLIPHRAEPLRVVSDQHGAPTFAEDIAGAVASILRKVDPDAPAGSTGGQVLAPYSGVYHCTAAGETTWYALATTAREFLQRHAPGLPLAEIVPVPTSEYPSRAVRPLNSRLDCDKLARTFGVRLPPWRESVDFALGRMAATERP